jgi:hypothetical protein
MKLNKTEKLKPLFTHKKERKSGTYSSWIDWRKQCIGNGELSAGGIAG